MTESVKDRSGTVGHTVLITAEEARALDPALEVPEVIHRLDDLIRVVASAGHKHIKVPPDLVRVSGVWMEFKTPTVSMILENAGYRVTQRRQKDHQPEAWLEISWGEK